MDWTRVKSVTIPEGDVQSVAIGGVTVWTKPSPLPYDAEVEWVATDGSQYVDTALAPGDNEIDFEIALRNLAPSTTLRGALGCRAETSAYVASSYAIFLRSSTTGELRADIANSGSAIYTRFPVNADGVVSWDAATRTLAVTVGGATDSYVAASKTTCADTFLLGSISTAGIPAAVGASMRIVSARFWRSGSLVRDYQPVRVGSGASAVGYLYDRANPTGGPLGNGLYGSATSTPLVAGPDKTGEG